MASFIDRFISGLRTKGTVAQRIGRAVARAEHPKKLRDAPEEGGTFPGRTPPKKPSWLDRFLRRKGITEAKLAETGLRGEGVPATGPFRPWQWGTVTPDVKGIGEEETRDFIEGGQPMFWQSSNIYMSQYFPSEEKLMIETRAGRVHLIRNITPGEAIGFLKAQSKGRWIWAHVRGPAQLRAPSTPGIPGLKPAPRIK